MFYKFCTFYLYIITRIFLKKKPRIREQHFAKILASWSSRILISNFFYEDGALRICANSWLFCGEIPESSWSTSTA